MSITSQRINRLAEKFGLKTYLEIGVFNGDTFNAVCLPSKTAVDPQFQFNTSDYEKDNVKFYEMPSDEFFYRSQLEDRVTKYDLIYIDGLHTYEQSYKDFINSNFHIAARYGYLMIQFPVTPGPRFPTIHYA